MGLDYQWSQYVWPSGDRHPPHRAGYVARSVAFLVAIIAQVRRMGRGGQNDLRGFKWLIAKISS